MTACLLSAINVFQRPNYFARSVHPFYNVTRLTRHFNLEDNQFKYIMKLAETSIPIPYNTEVEWSNDHCTLFFPFLEKTGHFLTGFRATPHVLAYGLMLSLERNFEVKWTLLPYLCTYLLNLDRQILAMRRGNERL